jgi:hypothetical protein
MIGAYSIGLHNRIGDEVRKATEPESRVISSEPARDQEISMKPPQAQGKVDQQRASPAVTPEAHFVDKPAPAFKPTLNVPKLVTSKDEKKKESAARSDEVTESMQNTFSEGLAKGAPPGATDLSAPSSPMPAQLRAKSSLSEASGSASAPASTSRRFSLSGGTLIVDAPDSLRIVRGEHGRSLLIYTSDGVIRIRLAD